MITPSLSKESGKWNEKYGIMVFKANYGYHSAMKKIVDQYIKSIKKEDSSTVVISEIDDNKVRTWIIGNPEKIEKMVNDELIFNK